MALKAQDVTAPGQRARVKNPLMHLPALLLEGGESEAGISDLRNNNLLACECRLRECLTSTLVNSNARTRASQKMSFDTVSPPWVHVSDPLKALKA